MKAIVYLFIATFSVNIYAAQKMGAEAVEMFEVLSHPQVAECMSHVPKMVNISIEKIVARCPGCNTYKISGHESGIDTPRAEQTVVTLAGKAVPGTFSGWIQTYSCDIQ